MVYAAINEKGERFYTHLKKVFEAINNRQRDYNWLISYAVCYPHDPDTARMLEQDYCWISGDDLTELVNREDFQWIWAVLSGFDKSVELSEVLKYELPYADGYEGFWQKPFSIQHPLAAIEIVPWDSSLTLLFSREIEIVDDFRKFFPYSENLEDYLDKEEKTRVSLQKAIRKQN